MTSDVFIDIINNLGMVLISNRITGAILLERQIIDKQKTFPLDLSFARRNRWKASQKKRYRLWIRR